MRTTTKKILAREILLLIGIIGISIITYVLTFPYNHFIESKAEHAKQSIEHLTDSLSSLQVNLTKLDSNRIALFLNLKDAFSKSAKYEFYDDYEQFKTRVDYLNSVDSLDELYKNWDDEVKSIMSTVGVNNAEQFETTITNSKFDETEFDSINQSYNTIRDSIGSIQRSIASSTSQILSSSDQFELGVSVLLFLSIVLYPVRLLILTIRWSIRTLKQNET